MKQKRKSGKRKTMGAGIWSVLLIALVLIVVVSYRCVELYDKNKDYQETTQELTQQLAQEEQRKEEIAAYEQSMGSDEAVEKIARERLGLVYRNEIVYKEAE